MSDYAFLSATTLARLIREREVSSVELLQYYLDRVDQYNEDLNSIIVQIRDEAMDAAKEADARLAKGEVNLGPLHGVPMTIKESYDVAGTPTTWGIPEMKDNIADEDALSVQRMKRAGVVLFGKTNVPLRLSDFQSYNDIYGTTNNPWNKKLIPGGSSGGSAATLASGMTGIESGSDIGGSIRNPAHFCGVFGHKPTWNLLPPRGHAMSGILSPSDLSVIGPLARSADDLETATLAMAGPDELMSQGMRLNLKPLKKNPSEWRVAVWRNDEMAPVDSEVLAAVDRVCETLKSLGAELDYDARPEFPAEHHHNVYQQLLQMTMFCRSPDDVYQEAVERANALDPNDQSMNALIIRNQVGRFKDWIVSNEQRTHIRWGWYRFFQDYDFVLAPIMARTAFPHDHGPMSQRTVIVNGKPRDYFEQVFWAGIAINAYLPSTVFPSGLASDGLPIGLQLIGPEYGDLTTIGVAKILEKEGYGFKAPPDYQ
ncbi:MAG: amidase [Gammaproteobacteria bacterium]|nr:amidase [Gammaproteobacteria bacterium]